MKIVGFLAENIINASYSNPEQKLNGFEVES